MSEILFLTLFFVSTTSMAQNLDLSTEAQETTLQLPSELAGKDEGLDLTEQALQKIEEEPPDSRWAWLRTLTSKMAGLIPKNDTENCSSWDTELERLSSSKAYLEKEFPDMNLTAPKEGRDIPRELWFAFTIQEHYVSAANNRLIREGLSPNCSNVEKTLESQDEYLRGRKEIESLIEELHPQIRETLKGNLGELPNYCALTQTC